MLKRLTEGSTPSVSRLFMPLSAARNEITTVSKEITAANNEIPAASNEITAAFIYALPSIPAAHGE